MFQRHFFSALAGLTLLAGAAAPATAQGSRSLDTIRARGELVCGTSPDLPGFAFLNEKGEFAGLYIDFCKALGAAILGDAKKVRYVPTTYANRLTALQSGEIDLLSSNTTWTMPREASLGLQFTGVLFYDGQGFLVSKKLGVKTPRDLDGASVCVQPGTTTEKNLADYFRANGMKLNPVIIESVEEIRNALTAGRCDAFTVGTSTLAAFREGLGGRKDEYVVLPDLISKEPLGPVVRKGDERFFDVVRWTQNAMILAEEFGIDSGNVEARMKDTQPDVQRLLGTTDDFGAMLGLKRDWAVQVIRQVGNLREVWDRHVAPMGLPRGRNALYTEGGLNYAPPIR
ncbi:amino acid ABC transporter substrate-binding protein [Pseudoroseomonas globiformis]|uniref:Amino acid ABC transporter substrate-binding protein n=1 Tax=Teichococcus globiformis TaxID=2307229 RepID=A0ABV7FTL0_9PROT